ncbi:hypothetical protein [uncultured Ferrovibrio sp.]|jgi:hypothetical protein|uniref:hypothetical protein n=1 Tax=uncultured Ferrovibrio sp. TaxID=1576913 RepID=UPI002608EFEE|nr:hypothetical protein [uncultured Ferrovibrio sp.]
MEFKIAYLEAMRRQAPKMFNQLQRSGQLDAHVQAKSAEAHRMLNEMLSNEPKLPSGLPKNLEALHRAEEIVMATLIEFPSDETPGEPLAPLNL